MSYWRKIHSRREVAANPYKENHEAAAVAREFCERMGFPPPQPTPYVKVNEPLAREMARYFEETPDQSRTSVAREAYNEFVKLLKIQFEMLPFEIIPYEEGEPEPYHSSEEMMDDLLVNRRLYVFNGGERHTLLTRKENFIFRAVHDALAHSIHGVAFGPRGELNAFLEHCKLLSPLARLALASETILQNSWFSYGPFAHLPAKDRPYAEQKVVLPKPKFLEWPVLQEAYRMWPWFFPDYQDDRAVAANPRRRNFHR